MACKTGLWMEFQINSCFFFDHLSTSLNDMNLLAIERLSCRPRPAAAGVVRRRREIISVEDTCAT